MKSPRMKINTIYTHVAIAKIMEFDSYLFWSICHSWRKGKFFMPISLEALQFIGPVSHKFYPTANT